MTSSLKKSKLLIEKLILTIPIYTKQALIQIIVNNKEHYSTQLYPIIDNKLFEINEIIEIEEKALSSISFIVKDQLNVSLASNQIRFNNDEKDSNLNTNSHDTNMKEIFLIGANNTFFFQLKYKVFLANSKNSENDIDNFYQEKLNNITKSKESSKDIESKESKSSNKINKLIDIASISNIEGFKVFVMNMRYLVLIENTILSLYNWENQVKTLFFLIILTILLLYKHYLPLFLPILIVFIHFSIRKQIESYMIIRQSSFSYLDGIGYITKIIDFFNKTVSFYEERIVKSLLSLEGKAAEFFYIETVKSGFLIYIIYILIETGIVSMSITKLLLYMLWVVFLNNNMNIKVFIGFMFVLFNSRFHLFSSVSKYFFILFEKIQVFLPFSQLFINNYSDENTNNTNYGISKISTSTKNEVSSKVEFGLYENERWWVLSGWKKTLLFNEVPVWSDLNMKVYTDKLSVFLPDDSYVWVDDWTFDISMNCDSQGWEYSDDFNSAFSKNSNGKYVRRRKWIRTAVKNRLINNIRMTDKQISS